MVAGLRFVGRRRRVRICIDSRACNGAHRSGRAAGAITRISGNRLVRIEVSLGACRLATAQPAALPDARGLLQIRVIVFGARESNRLVAACGRLPTVEGSRSPLARRSELLGSRCGGRATNPDKDRSGGCAGNGRSVRIATQCCAVLARVFPRTVAVRLCWGPLRLGRVARRGWANYGVRRAGVAVVPGKCSGTPRRCADHGGGAAGVAGNEPARPVRFLFPSHVGTRVGHRASGTRSEASSGVRR